LQSTNEELETAKEELQSTNEELTTLNDELLSRNKDLDFLSNDLLNVLSNANVSIIMVGSDLRIRRFTPMAEKYLKLIAADVGRNLMDINLGFPMEKLDEKIAEVIRTKRTIEMESQDRDGHWFSIQIRPYRTIDNKVEGAVIVFMNVDDIKFRENQALEAERFSDGIIQTVRDPLVVLGRDLLVERANRAFYDIFRVKPEVTIGRKFYDLGNGQWDIPELRTLLEKVLPEKLEVRDFVISHAFEQIGKKEMTLNARTLEWDGEKKLFLLISIHDHTPRQIQAAVSPVKGLSDA
jgi:two-component system CheB/CheR fusion protein